jgi:hypothetical protein
MPTALELAKLLFNAYNEHGLHPWKTFDGRDVPRWDELNDAVRGKWIAAAIAADRWLMNEARKQLSCDGTCAYRCARDGSPV